MADGASAVKREKSTKLGATTVDIYVHALGGEAAKKAAEAGGLGLLPSLVDWTKARNAVLFYVGREDLYHRVEQKFDLDGKAEKSGSIVLEFSEFNKASCRLPDDVRKKLGIE
jgi:hypothetical protein